MKTTDILTQIETSKKHRDEFLLKEIDRLCDYNANMKLLLNKLSDKISMIIEAIENRGLEISEFNYQKTGSSHIWNDSDNLKLIITARSTGKFKFIKFKGYDSKGRGKNQKILDEKAARLNAFIKGKTGLSTVQVNPFSLECEDEELKNKTILIDAWL